MFDTKKEKDRKILVIVDFQYDFYDKENGALYVPGAENIVDNICSEIESKKYDEICLTLDWHKIEDKSFKENGGQWPIHCVQNTLGSTLHPKIIDSLNKSNVKYSFFYKGTNPEHEEYGAFEKYDYGFNFLHNKVHYFYNNEMESNFKFFAIKDYIEVNYTFCVCGLAGDYCVKETIKNILKHGFNVEPLYDCIAWIGEKQEYKSFINIGLFLGSFDPPHIGHTLCCVDAMNSGKFDKIYVIPSYQNPWKNKSSDYFQRVKMCRENFYNINNVYISEIEGVINPEYTHITLKNILKNNFESNIDSKFVKYTIIGGSDIKEEVSRWKEGEWILENFDFYEVKRDKGTPKSINISSTELREMIKNNESTLPFLTKIVEDIAKELYNEKE